MKNAVSPSVPTEFRDELNTLLTDTEAVLSGKLSERTSEVINDLRVRLAAARERCAETYDRARDSVAAGYDRAKDSVAAGARCTDTAIRENPYQALGITLGTGLLLGALVGLLLGRRGL